MCAIGFANHLTNCVIHILQEVVQREHFPLKEEWSRGLLHQVEIIGDIIPNKSLCEERDYEITINEWFTY